ncbi:MAG: CAP domain-containing protein [Synechococcales cyanobacterium RU_4_20]|nr:CAP domain-containing protein [Synechococcales cyanobacterium RU_4_20]
MAVNIYSNLSGDGFEPEELRLFNLVNQYRSESGLPAIKASKALSLVANRHVQDLAENVGRLTHAWSDAPYDPSSPNTFSSMWTAPERFNTGYKGYGFENAFYSGGSSVNAQQALNSWKNSSPHNAVVLNQGVWSQNWNALGVGIHKGYAVLWFGREEDPTGAPTGLPSLRTLAPSNAPQYIASHPDLIRAIGYNLEAASQHYSSYGMVENRALDAFDEFRYIASYADLLSAFGNDGAGATWHYIQYGNAEGRSPNLFNSERYLASNKDLIREFGYNLQAASQHYVTYGVSERRATQSFDPLLYLSRYADLRNAFGNNLTAATQHFIDYGYQEGRLG